MKNEKGMTLVALIISLIVMIILSAIVIFTVVENTKIEQPLPVENSSEQAQNS